MSTVTRSVVVKAGDGSVSPEELYIIVAVAMNSFVVTVPLYTVKLEGT